MTKHAGKILLRNSNQETDEKTATILWHHFFSASCTSKVCAVWNGLMLDMCWHVLQTQ